MDISVVGTGYVGLTVATVLAHRGHQVTCIDIDQLKIGQLSAGQIPFYEPGLDKLLQQTLQRRYIRFTDNFEEGVTKPELVFLTVGTPPRSDGSPDLLALEAAIHKLAQVLKSATTVVIKSTVPVGTTENAEMLLNEKSEAKGHVVLFNPEFLREGSAVRDFLNPDRIIIGASETGLASPLLSLYRSFHTPCIITDRRTAEFVKYASNAFLATRISFINELAGLCDQLGVDVSELSRGMGLDHRIGSGSIQAGIGYGGSCFPKDVAALLWMFESNGQKAPLLEAVQKVNLHQRERALSKLVGCLSTLVGKQIAILGLTFKPRTDDVRGAPAIDIIQGILRAGGKVSVYDPVWKTSANEIVPGCTATNHPYDAIVDADALFLMTEWEEFLTLDWLRVKHLMRNPVVIDGRNCLDPIVMHSLGFHYVGFGRGAVW